VSSRASTLRARGVRMRVVAQTQVLWWRPVSPVTIGCEPGQVRKEAAAASDSGAGIGLVAAASCPLTAHVGPAPQLLPNSCALLSAKISQCASAIYCGPLNSGRRPDPRELPGACPTVSSKTLCRSRWSAACCIRLEQRARNRSRAPRAALLGNARCR